jgi:hypothetical protein
MRVLMVLIGAPVNCCLDLLSLVVDQVDHFAMERRQLRQASLRDVSSFALIHRAAGVSRVFDDRSSLFIQLAERRRH